MSLSTEANLYPKQFVGTAIRQELLFQVCGEKGHRKMDCQKLPEERRNELKVIKD
jgi:hypothetical protein